MKKKALSIAIAVMLTFVSTQGLGMTAQASTQPSPWAVDYVERAIELSIVPQNLQANYTQPTTRAEFAALAVTLYEKVTGSTVTGRMRFNDTVDIDVQKAGYLGVTTGVGNGNFNPNGQLTREQAAVMLARLANVIGQPLPQSAPTFADNWQLSVWAYEAVGQVQAAGIMGGVGDNRFAPSGNYTREQSIVTILRLFERLYVSEDINVNPEASTADVEEDGEGRIVPIIPESYQVYESDDDDYWGEGDMNLIGSWDDFDF